MRSIIVTLVLFAVSLAASYASGVVGEEAVTADSFEYDGIREIRLRDGSFFDVVINGSSRTAVAGQVAMPEKNLDKYRIVHEKRGPVLEISLEKKVAILGITGKNEIILEVPTQTLLDIVTSSGSQVVEGIESARMVLKASSGDILLLAGTGNVSAEVTGNITARSSSGDQKYENVTGDIAAQSSSGKITIREQTGMLDLKATSGDLKGEGVRLTGNSSFATSSGRIEFDFSNPIEEISFDLSASSGSLRAGESRGEKRLVLQGGGIRIVGKSSSGDQTYQ
jgi:hypothetical protein